MSTHIWDDDDSNDSDFRCLNHQIVVEPVGEVDIFLQLSLESSIETVDIQTFFCWTINLFQCCPPRYILIN
jgi:hypothetical protein